jgi:hypothetical protein
VTARAQRRLALVAGLVLALVFTVCSAFQVVAWTAGSVHKKAHKEIAGPVHNLTVEANNGDITLISAPAGSAVIVDSDAKGSLHAPELDTEVFGTDVKVSGGCPEITFGNCSATLVVRVPAGTQVEVESASGDIVADGLSADATLRAHSGDIEAHALGGDSVQLESASGDVAASAMRAPVVRARTASGDVSLQFAVVPSAGEAQTNSGDAIIEVPRGDDAYNATADSNSGDDDVHVRYDPRSRRLLRAETNSGDATISHAG